MCINLQKIQRRQLKDVFMTKKVLLSAKACFGLKVHTLLIFAFRSSLQIFEN
jgi:hypothetical protein